MRTLKLVLILCSLSFLNLYAQEDVNTNKISIFTDGNSFVEKTIKLTPQNNTFLLKDKFVPKARLGTLLIVDKDNSITSIKSFVDTIRTANLISRVSSTSYIDILKANLNKVVTITTDKKVRTGEVVELILYNQNSPSHIIFKEASEYNLLRINDILNISFPSKPIIPSSGIVQNDPYSVKKVTDLKLNIALEFKDSKAKEISMKYLQRGVSWTPFYYLELDDNRKVANLTLKAEVINDSEEIKESDLDLFIGEPNFEYSDYLTDLIDFKNLLNPDYDGGLGNSELYISALAVSGNKGAKAQGKSEPKNYQDFHIYKIENESLKKNSRAHYNLLETELEYRHVYVCDLLNISNEINIQNKKDNKVYHSLKFVNKTDNLFAEGPITIIDDTDKNYIPLAQSKMEYTPSQATGLLKITESLDIEITQSEEVIEVDDALLRFWRVNYQKARIKATIKLNNYKNEKIAVMLRQVVFGDVDESPSFKILEKKEKYYLPNAINNLEWNLELKANEEKEVVYEYEYYRYGW